MTTPNGAPEWAGSQASPDVTVNEAIRRTEAGANQYLVVDKDLTAPPGSCTDGATYIVGGSPTGAWVGHAGDLAIAVGANAASGWYFRDPAEGIMAWVQDEDSLYRCSTGTSPASWSVYTAGAPPIALDDLTDVVAPSPSDGQVLVYDASSPAHWKAGFPPESLVVACSDETTAITTGVAKTTFRMPYAFTLTEVRASVTTAPTGSTILIDINEAGSTILSTKLMIDASEKTSTTAATPAVISDASLADDAEITIDFDQVGSTIAGAGVKVTLIGHRP